MAFVAGATMAVHAAPPERLGQAIGIFGLTFLAMNGVAPVVVEELSRRGDWSWGFALAAAAALLSAALSRRVADVPGRVDPSGETPSLAEVLARPYMLRALLVIALVGMALGSAFNFYQLFALERGIPEVRGFFVAYTAAAVFVRLGLGRVIDAAGRRQVSVASLVLYVVVILSMSEVRPAVFELLGAGLGAAHGLFYPAFNAIAVEGALRNARGKVMASFQAAFHVGSAGGAVLLGELAGRSGYPGVFAAAGLGTLLALVLLVALPEPEESR
jgi:predicted MFS family arabinose efflux permease